MKITFILFVKSLLLLISFFIIEQLLSIVFPYVFQAFHANEILGGFIRLIPEPILEIILSSVVLIVIEVLLIQNFIDEQFHKTRITLYTLVALRIIIAFLFLVYIFSMKN